MKSKILLTLVIAGLTISHADQGVCSGKRSFSEVQTEDPSAAGDRRRVRTEGAHVKLDEAYIQTLFEKLSEFKDQDKLGTTHTLFGVGSRYVYPESVSRKNMHTYIRTNPRESLHTLDFKQLFPSKIYKPVPFTARGLDSTGVDGKPGVNNDLIHHAWPNGYKWADPEDIRLIPVQLSSGRVRATILGVSFDGKPYALTESYTLENGEKVEGYPKNPRGHTGIVGRGELGLWGANFAADPVLLRKNESGRLEVLLVKRLDGRQWSLPGGMFDPEDKTVSVAAVRELAQETGINQSRETPLNLHELLKWFKTITVSFGQIYTGYCDDPRNTDNAWMETSAHLWLMKKGVNFHIDPKGDETVKVGWFTITPELLGDQPVHGKKLFASHSFILRQAVRELLRQRY